MQFGPDPAWVFHITHIDNLPIILREGGLLSENETLKQDISFTRIGHTDLKGRRANTEVPIEPGGVIADYVPFYFAPRSPMLFSIYRNNVEGYTEGQTPIIYIVGKAQDIGDNGLRFVFTDGHAAIRLSDYYNRIEDLQNVDWQIMNAKYWNDNKLSDSENAERRRKRMAEFLVFKFFPIDYVHAMVTFDDAIKDRVSGLLNQTGHSDRIQVLSRRDWYF